MAAELVSWAGYSHYYSKKYHFYYLNSCLAWHWGKGGQMGLGSIKTLDLIVEYAFQLKAYI